MDTMKNSLAVGVLSFFLTGALSAAEVAQIGIIDFQKILELSNVGKTAQVRFIIIRHKNESLMILDTVSADPCPLAIRFKNVSDRT